jgi:molybdopterin/thiamine biosynthesis adenylyltransferase
MAGAAFGRWRQATLAVIGAGALGSHFAVLAVRRGARVLVIDPDIVSASNLATQAFTRAMLGHAKVDAVVAACDAIAPGRARGVRADVRHVGAGVLAGCTLLVDCTDDGGLTLFLTELSNGLRRPLLRLAVDGSGEREVARAFVSHGTDGHACQVCPLSASDLARAPARTPCPGSAPTRRPTLAGPVAHALVGVGLLQAQRVVTGRGREHAWDRELVLDLDAPALHALTITRSAACLSGHARWDVIALPETVHALTLRALFAHGQAHLGTAVTLHAHNGALALTTVCRCGERARPGLLSAPPPLCADCGERARRQPAVTLSALNHAQAQALAIAEVPLAELGFPRGAAIGAMAPHGRTVHFITAGT